MTRKVVILGRHAKTAESCPWNDASFEIWALPWDDAAIRADRWFELHHPKTFTKRHGAEYVEKLKGLKTPLFMQETRPEFPSSVEYPLSSVMTGRRDYFSNTVAYMIALAVHERVNEIHLFGVELAASAEYRDQRCCVEYWLGVAEGSGIRVVAAPGSHVLSTVCGYRYAYEEP